MTVTLQDTEDAFQKYNGFTVKELQETRALYEVRLLSSKDETTYIILRLQLISWLIQRKLIGEQNEATWSKK